MVVIERRDVAFSNLKDSTQIPLGKILHLIPLSVHPNQFSSSEMRKITIVSEAISTRSRRAILNRVSRTGNGLGYAN